MRILIVEDEPKVASFIKNGLEENNYEAETIHDGLLAENLAREMTITCISWILSSRELADWNYVKGLKS